MPCLCRVLPWFLLFSQKSAVFFTIFCRDFLLSLNINYGCQPALWCCAISMVFEQLYGLLGRDICRLGCSGRTTLMLPWCSWTWNPGICCRPCCGDCGGGEMTLSDGCCGWGWRTICCCWMRYWCIIVGDDSGAAPPSQRNIQSTWKQVRQFSWLVAFHNFHTSMNTHTLTKTHAFSI